MIFIPQKGLFSGLHFLQALRYSRRAVAKSAAGRGNPCNSMATQHAPCVFFYVVALAYQFFAQWFLHRCRYQAMVAQAGQPSGWPVFIEAGISTPVWATTHKRGNFGGSNNHDSMEAATMATSLTPLHPQFIYLFAAVRRTELTARPCMLRTTASSEKNARLRLTRDYILSFAGRLPLGEVA
ncbi:host cell division inhibitor Icd-like protein [Yersinia kristensenii]|uniref:host cell division inhibitor Icd-like protein n=2 Tax=Yersinia TaxID=629 RepID=UPI000C15D46B|nr:host cell division inhibitor Icd-like protein [Yersinia kristensenii]MDA5524549.1 host cell division inhibitor Icd-like protein [Yersinia kristensenii]PHZ35523.1 Ash-like/host cell division inhibitor Icd-like protein [Yersinia kristensenii]